MKKRNKTNEINKGKLYYKEELRKAKEDVEDLEWYIGEFTSFLPIAVCSLSAIGVIIDINKSFHASNSLMLKFSSGNLIVIIIRKINNKPNDKIYRFRKMVYGL